MPEPALSEHFARKLAARAPIPRRELAAFSALPWRERHIAAGVHLAREGQPPLVCGFVVEGYAYRHKLTQSGQRAIVAVLVPGDMIDLQNLFLNKSDHDVIALTPLTLAEVPIAALRELVEKAPRLAASLWTDALIQASISREWLLNVGRRPAKARLAHLLCEFHARLRAIKGGDAMEYELPMTQEQLGDAMGLTPVHVNRVLRELAEAGLICREKRRIKVTDWDRLREAGEFDELYLHLEQVHGGGG